MSKVVCLERMKVVPSCSKLTVNPHTRTCTCFVNLSRAMQFQAGRFSGIEGVVQRVTPALYSSRYPIIFCCEQKRQQRSLNYSCSVARCQCFACLGRTEILKSIRSIALTTCCSSRRCFGFYRFSCSLGPDHNFLLWYTDKKFQMNR